MEAKDKIIVALDVFDLNEAIELIDELKGNVGMFKVGSQLFTAVGPRILDYLKSQDQKIFLDLKYHDNPSTVAKSVQVAGNYGVDFISIHSCVGKRGLEAAVEQKSDSKLLAVSILTGMTADECFAVYNKSPEQLTFKFALTAKDAGIDGVVCAPSKQELGELTEDSRFDGLIKVCPGIRGIHSQIQDQRRVATPFEAVALGADYLVIGRPITQTKTLTGSRTVAAQWYVSEVASAMATMS